MAIHLRDANANDLGQNWTNCFLDRHPEVDDYYSLEQINWLSTTAVFQQCKLHLKRMYLSQVTSTPAKVLFRQTEFSFKLSVLLMKSD